MIQRIATMQAHRLPAHTYYASGPQFDADIMATGTVEHPEPEPEPVGDTQLVRCTDCRAVLRATDTDYHVC